MTSSTGIEVKRAILHLTEPGSRGFLPSDSSFSPNAEVATFLCDHIQRSLRDSSLRTCAFNQPKAGSISAWLTSAAAADEDEFVDLTKRAAEQLYSTLASNRSISDGSIVFVEYEVGGVAAPCLALLKMDPAPGFATESVAGSNKIAQREAMLPSTRQRLHKCAFVQPEISGEPLTVLDLQSDGAGKIRAWFLADYLEAKLALTDAELTSAFYHAAMRGSGEIADESRKRRFQAGVNGMIAGAHINVSDFVDQSDLSDDEREKIDDKLTRLGPDRDFDVDAPTRDALLAKVRFSGDNGLTLTASATAYESSVSVVDNSSSSQPTTNTHKFRITIDTNQWSQRL